MVGCYCRRCTISRSLGHFINSKQLSQRKTVIIAFYSFCWVYAEQKKKQQKAQYIGGLSALWSGRKEWREEGVFNLCYFDCIINIVNDNRVPFIKRGIYAVALYS